ncbi:lytic transglycosylase domain-containing protein [Kitasatospora sp. MBT63]|uniref:aggregation-promoting factor C-terminal-like domain-containing protein n=1 Tax=Kitasatospora sp. MBT63 TaxID=1444768 RepID=UPI00068E37B4|nr:lytic transglycosylase domain-containing protein [Kitasatospora sp. MBT63]
MQFMQRHKHRLPRNRRTAMISGVATLAVVGSATLALALPQDAKVAEAAAPVTAAASPDAQVLADQAAADAAKAQADQQAKADADAKAAADAAQAQADADAKAKADADAKAAADAAQAQADADAKAKADAAAKAKAAKAKADADARAKAEAASRSQARSPLAAPVPTGTPQQIAAQLVPAGQLQCFSNIVERESGWNVTATNPSSGAYGLMQALPGSKMASVGADWKTNPVTQIKWGLQYMNETYGSPCAAWAFWQAHNWY